MLVALVKLAAGTGHLSEGFNVAIGRRWRGHPVGLLMFERPAPLNCGYSGWRTSRHRVR